MAKGKLFLIDATGFCYRAFYAVRGLTTSSGQPTNAVYGFANMLNKIVREGRPDFIAACFDVSRDTFRQKKFAGYKVQRQPMPDGLHVQMPFIRRLLEAYGISIFEKEGYEADDIIATIACRGKEEGLRVRIVSSDKDMLQLVEKGVEVFNPYKDSGVIYDEEKVEDRFGIKPRQIPDIVALMGDDVDNIPGISGIGEKTAVSLIREFGSLDALLVDAGRIKSAKIARAVGSNIAAIRLNRELAVLDRRVKLDLDIDALRPSPSDKAALLGLFRELVFKKFIQELKLEDAALLEEDAPQASSRDLEQLLAHPSEIVLGFGKNGLLSASAGGSSFSFGRITKPVGEILARRDIPKVGHDLKGIKVALGKQGVTLEGASFDTMVAAYLLNPGRGSYSLEDLKWDYLPREQAGPSSEDRGSLGIVVGLKPVLESQLKKAMLLDLFRDIEMPLVEVLARMEITGIKLDLGILEKLSGELEKRLVCLIDDIYKMSGVEFNINSPKQLRTILFERLKLPVVKKTKTGPSTDEEVLKTLAAAHELPALLLEYRQLSKLKNTYVDTLPAQVDPATARLHTSFNQTATETGRLSSSNPNLQNIPTRSDIGSRIRQAIVAFSPDSCLLACDYSQIELRILAHISGDNNLITEFQQGKDVHRATAALIYGVTEGEITDAMRDTAKRVNFGIIYGLTSYGLARDLGIPLDKAQDFIDAYLAKYPRVSDYMAEAARCAEKDGFVTTITGRRRYIPEIKDRNQAVRQLGWRKAVNTPIQGSASDLIKTAMVAIDRLITEKNLQTRMILQVHDELVFDVPSEELDAAAGLIRDKMEHVMELKVPVSITVKKGKNWLEMETVN